MKDITRVQSIDRAVAILECFSEENKKLKLSEISENKFAEKYLQLW